MAPPARSLLIAAMMAGVAAYAPPAASGSLLDVAPKEVAFQLGAETARPTADQEIDWLLPFRDASIERLGPMRLYTSSRWGRWHDRPWMVLTWSDPGVQPEAEVPLGIHAAPVGVDLTIFDELRDRGWSRTFDATPLAAFDSTGERLDTDGLSVLWRLPPVKPVVDWRCRRRPVTIVRFGAESADLELVRCDGSTAPEALDKLSILARPPEADRPGDMLPEDPDETAWRERREWTPGVRVMHPRLLWALQQLSDAFPRRSIYLYSGYRPLAEVNDGSGHKSLHAEGRAVDISVGRVPAEEVFKVCRELKDVGCGFYPNSKFVHVDVRRAHTGKAFWIDASAPGEPAKYVDAWPGVVDKGAAPFLATSRPQDR